MRIVLMLALVVLGLFVAACGKPQDNAATSEVPKSQANGDAANTGDTVSCSGPQVEPDEDDKKPDEQSVWIRVDGMTKVQGIT